MRPRHLRRHRRPGPQEADPGRSTTWPTAACCRRASWSLGFARRDWGDDDFEALAKEAAQEHARTPWRDEVWARLAGNIKFVGGSFDDDNAFDELAADARRAARHAPASTATRRSTCRSRRPRSRSCSSSSRAPAWPTTRSPAAGAGWSWRSRSATTCESAKQLNSLVDDVFTAAGRVPHRPLPGQGDGPEHPGAALRQHAVRAGVELELRRLGADHDGRGRRHRHPRRLLRHRRHRPRRAAEPPAAAARAWSRWRSRRASRRTRSAPRSSRCSSAITLPEDVAQGHRPRAVPARLGGRRARRRDTCEEKDVPPDSTTETYVAVAPRHPEPALGRACRSTSGPASGMPRRVTEIAVMFKRAPHLPFHPADVEIARQQPAGRPGPAGRGRDAEVRLQGARHHDGGARHRDGLPVRRGVHRLVARRRTSG